MSLMIFLFSLSLSRSLSLSLSHSFLPGSFGSGFLLLGRFGDGVADFFLKNPEPGSQSGSNLSIQNRDQVGG